MQSHRGECRLCAMCRVLRVNRAGYDAWLKSPKSERAREDERLLGLIKRQWLASGSVYGHRKITKDLRDLAERCSGRRVHRPMRSEGVRAQVGDARKPRFHGGAGCAAAANLLDRQFEVTVPGMVWASDFTFITLGISLATFAGWLAGLGCEATGIAHWLSPRNSTRKLYSTLRVGREALVRRWPMEPVSRWLARLRALHDPVRDQMTLVL
ncbi:ISxac3 transposase [Xanthomonas bromi]|uniref:ISxac3 transposase n=1 Tax=Xanthomonas bromi TaxID=56449 RepID=A0A1C3NM94_9XANT|nr:ISxac3 transposase [Xanthomonas bromi]